MTDDELKVLRETCCRVGDNWGTGYLVDKNYVVTCAHVIRDKGKGSSVPVQFINKTRVEAKVYEDDKENDCAILKLTQPITDVTPLALAKDCPTGAPWVGYGFPQIPNGQGFPLDGEVKAAVGEDDKGKPALILYSKDAAASQGDRLHGFSGSPVLVGGTVVGHLKRMLVDSTNRTSPVHVVWGSVYATPSSAIATLLGRPLIACPLHHISQTPSFNFSKKDQREFELLQKWFGDEVLCGTSALSAAEDLIKIDCFERALRVLYFAEEGLRRDQLRGLALGKIGKVDEAIKVLERLRANGARDAETLGLLGGRYKDKWRETGNINFLQAAYDAYREAFEFTQESYPGINVAAIALYLGKSMDSKDYAKKVLNGLEGSESNGIDNWKLASAGEAYLLLGDLESARTWYSRAVSSNPMAQGDIAKMRRQARLDFKTLGLPLDSLDSILFVPRVVAFTGHMTDVPDRELSRFPDEKKMVFAVRMAIREKLKALNVGYGFGSAARGADILFAQELLERHSRMHLFLPFPSEDFAQTSVGYGWNQRYNDVLENDEVDVTILTDSLPSEEKQPDAYSNCNSQFCRAAVAKAKRLDEEPILLAVINSKFTNGSGGSFEAIRAWEDEGYTVELIDIAKL